MTARQLILVASVVAVAAPAFELPQSPILSPNTDFRQFMDNNHAAMEQDRSQVIRRIREQDDAPSYEEMVRINSLLRGKPAPAPPAKKPAFTRP